MENRRFLLKNMPRARALREAASAYPGMDVAGLDAFSALLETAAEVLCAINTGLGRSGVSQARFRVLLLLRVSAAGLHPMDLAGELGVERATITGLVDGLERSGLAARRPCDGDRRAVIVALTPKGRAMMDRLAPHRLQKVARLMGGLTGAEKRQLARILDKLKSRIPDFGKE